MLTIDADVMAAVVAHARRDHPEEACGLIVGPAGTRHPTRHIPMDNAERSTTFYRFDPDQWLKVWRELEDNDEEAVVIYHSHTATEAYPSRTDVALAAWMPDAHYLLVSTRNPDSEEIRVFRIVDGAVTEEPREVVMSGVDSHAVQSYMFGQTPASVDYECRTGS